MYDSGSIFDPTILDITDDDLKESMMAAIRNVAALSLKIGNNHALIKYDQFSLIAGCFGKLNYAA